MKLHHKIMQKIIPATGEKMYYVRYRGGYTRNLKEI